MHQIIADECTGCGLCIDPCPVDCIELLPLETPNYDIERATQRFEARNARLERQAREKRRVYQQGIKTKQQEKSSPQLAQDYIKQALARKAQNKVHP